MPHAEENPYAPPASQLLPLEDIDEPGVEINSFHPWRRYFARTIDGNLFAIPISTVLYHFYKKPDLHHNFAYLISMSIIISVCWGLVYLFIEAWLISNYQCTPGKWLYNIRIRNKENLSLTYTEAWWRAFNVLAKGEGFNLPLIAFITMFYQYNILKNDGSTRWDSPNAYRVIYKPIFKWRWAIIVTTLILIPTRKQVQYAYQKIAEQVSH